MKLLVGIVKYNPDENRLKECIESVKGYDLFTVDNTENNIGVAAGLRKIMQHAIENGYDWVLTLDQDSVVQKSLIDEYLKYVHDDSIGALTCKIVDRNFTETQIIGKVDKCITSGCFMRVDAYKKTSGYDDWMFIDRVDWDICYSIIEAGYSIVRIDFEGLLHEVGRGEKYGKFYSYNEPSWRRYYMTRNGIYVAKKHTVEPYIKALLREIRDMVLVFVFEDNKWLKLKESIRGIKDVKKAPLLLENK